MQLQKNDAQKKAAKLASMAGKYLRTQGQLALQKAAPPELAAMVEGLLFKAPQNEGHDLHADVRGKENAQILWLVETAFSNVSRGYLEGQSVTPTAYNMGGSRYANMVIKAVGIFLAAGALTIAPKVVPVKTPLQLKAAELLASNFDRSPGVTLSSNFKLKPTASAAMVEFIDQLCHLGPFKDIPQRQRAERLAYVGSALIEVAHGKSLPEPSLIYEGAAIDALQKMLAESAPKAKVKNQSRESGVEA